MLIDFRKNKTAPDPVILKGKQVERVVSFKNLGSTLDDIFSWSKNINAWLMEIVEYTDNVTISSIALYFGQYPYLSF